MSYLPLSHIFERLVLHSVIYSGGEICFFGGDVLKLKDDWALYKPTIIPIVPRLINKFSLYVGFTAWFNPTSVLWLAWKKPWPIKPPRPNCITYTKMAAPIICCGIPLFSRRPKRFSAAVAAWWSPDLPPWPPMSLISWKLPLAALFSKVTDKPKPCNFQFIPFLNLSWVLKPFYWEFDINLRGASFITDAKDSRSGHVGGPCTQT